MRTEASLPPGLVLCEKIFTTYHREEYLYPDPLYLVRSIPPDYREPWALFMAMISLGTVKSILSMGNKVLERIGIDGFMKGPDFLARKGLFDGLKYRFYSTGVLQEFCMAIARLLQIHGTLEQAAACMALNQGEGMKYQRILQGLRTGLRENGVRDPGHLLPDPYGTSANKRYAMFLRWVVRKDEIDLGLWSILNPGDLVMPIDTHILRNSQILGLSSRTSADGCCSREVTESLRRLCPSDPVRYDFSLSRIGIHPELRDLDLKSMMSSLTMDQ